MLISTSHAESRQPNRQAFPVEKMLNPSVYSHPVTDLRVIETHISWVILTGEFAYKIKKPIKFDFVDYSTLEKRCKYCEEEIALNARYSSDIYLDVVPIFEIHGNLFVRESVPQESACKPGNEPSSGPWVQSEPVEYAVRMKQFSQESILDQLIQNPEFDPELIGQFAVNIALFHRSENPIHVDDPEGELLKTRHEVSDNFELLERELKETSAARQISAIKNWSFEQLEAVQDTVLARFREGKFKKCHGDLHLQNIIFHDGKLVPFDGIEFNQDLQNVDVFHEVAFPFMDFLSHHKPEFAWRFLSAYLEVEGDYQDLELIRFFAVYLAMVRAKVSWINCQNQTAWGRPAVTHSVANEDGCRQTHPWDRYLELAESLIDPTPLRLALTFGFSGSGKSTRALAEIESQGGIRIRSDVERRRAKEKCSGPELYDSKTTDQIYNKLLKDAEWILNAGVSVVVDATFLSSQHRLLFRSLAKRLNVDFEILACDASFIESVSRIKNREDDPSEATIQVLKQQMDTYDPLTKEEQRFVKKTVPQD